VHNRPYRLLLVLMSLPLVVHAEMNTPQHKSDFTMKYAQFIFAFEYENWNQVSKFENSKTKCGFGPGEEGIGCIEKKYSSDEKCMKDVLFALNQGCRIDSTQKDYSCTSPPQWGSEPIKSRWLEY